MKSSNLKTNLDSRVYEELVTGYIKGAYAEGQKMDPAQISEQYSISRTPVVQALKRMHTEGLLYCTSGGKYYVPWATEKDINDICDVRSMLETQALKKLIEADGKKYLEELRRLSVECHKLNEHNDVTGSVRKDLQLHLRIVESCENDCLTQVYLIVRNRLLSLNYTAIFRQEYQKSATREHIYMMDAIDKGNKEDALRLLQGHVEPVRSRLLAHVAARVGNCPY